MPNHAWLSRFAAVAVLIVAVAGAAGVARISAASIAIAAVNYEFRPSSRTVKVGDTVVWTMSGDPHTVRSGTIDANHVGHPSDGPLKSEIIVPGDTYSHTFTAPGTYSYFCEIHADSQMKGTIVVAAVIATLRPTPRPTPRVTPRPTPRPTQAPTSAATPAPTPDPTPTLTPTATPNASPTPIQTRAAVATGSPVTTASLATQPAATPYPAGSGAPPASDATPIVIGAVVFVILIVAATLWQARRRS